MGFFKGRGPDWCNVCGRTLRGKGTCKYCDKKEKEAKNFF